MVLHQELSGRGEGHVTRVNVGVVVNAGADARECDTLQAVVPHHVEAGAVGVAQQFGLLSDGSDRVNDVFSG